MVAKKSGSTALIQFDKETFNPDEFYMQSSYGLLIGALGVVWLAQEVGWLDTAIPFGPLTIILLGLMIMFSRIKKRAN